MGLLDRVAAALPAPPGRQVEQRYSADTWLTDFYLPSLTQFGGYPSGLRTTYDGVQIRDIAGTLPGYLSALRQCPPAFAAQMVRSMVLSQARFRMRRRPGGSGGRRLFGTSALSLLEQPWPGGTTGDLLGRMEWHAGLAGNAFVARQPKRVRLLRPDWVGILYGSEKDPDYPDHALDGTLLGYVYANGGWGRKGPLDSLLPSEVAHWSPLPDPECAGVGMSWITPAIRDIKGDLAAADHKLMFFKNGATPNLVVKGIPATNSEQFQALVDMMEATHAGIENAYRTLYLTAGADATVVGADMQQLDFAGLQGTGETRITFLSRVPAPLLGIAMGLQGSSLNSGNFGMARRTFADTWVFPVLQSVCAALGPLVNVPSDSELWFDTTDIPLLREDAKDAAAIEQTRQQTISGYVRDGFTADSAVAAVVGQDPTLLEHTGLLSVQLQPPGGPPPNPQTQPTGGTS